MAVNGTAETAPTPTVSLRLPNRLPTNHPNKFRERPDAWRAQIAPHKSGLSLHLPKFPPVQPQTPTTTPLKRRVALRGTPPYPQRSRPTRPHRFTGETPEPPTLAADTSASLHGGNPRTPNARGRHVRIASRGKPPNPQQIGRASCRERVY